MSRETRSRAILRVWWLWLPIGIALTAYAVAGKTNLLSRGGPFAIGLILLIWGVAGALAATRGA